MRFLLPGLGLNIALCGLLSPNLAVAAPLPLAALFRSPSHQLTIAQNATDEGTAIRGNGVEFTAPAGFEGGSPSDAQTKTLVRETAKAFPSMASFAQMLDRNPGALRALAIDPNKSNSSAVLVQQLPITTDISLEDLQKSMAEIMPTMLPPEVKLVGNRIVKIGSRQIIKMDLEINLQGVKLNESMGLLKEGNEIFQVVYAFDRQNAGQAQPNFDRMIRTFKATPTTPEKSPTI